jgi:hypothetical protein
MGEEKEGLRVFLRVTRRVTQPQSRLFDQFVTVRTPLWISNTILILLENAGRIESLVDVIISVYIFTLHY